MNVILVDESDVQIGVMEKMEAHKKAILHRAFSIFIFDIKGNMLLHKRAAGKYHSAGLWTNACCSHPAPGLDTAEAAQLRLKEEMGFTTTLVKAFDFVYKASFDNGLTEHEYDHVFIGTYEGEIIPDENEVSDYEYLPLTKIKDLLQRQPQQFTAWFKIAFPKLEVYLSTIA